MVTPNATPAAAASPTHRGVVGSRGSRRDGTSHIHMKKKPARKTAAQTGWRATQTDRSWGEGQGMLTVSAVVQAW